MSGVIAGVLVVDADQADLHFGGGISSGLFGLGGFLGLGRLLSLLAAAGSQTQDHDQSEKHCKELLHAKNPPSKMLGIQVRNDLLY